MTEKQTPTIKDLAVNSLAPKQTLFMSTYTGIEPSQLAVLTEQQRTKAFLGLVKQLELTASLHFNPISTDAGNGSKSQPKDLLRLTLIDFFLQELTLCKGFLNL